VRGGMHSGMGTQSEVDRQCVHGAFDMSTSERGM